MTQKCEVGVSWSVTVCNRMKTCERVCENGVLGCGWELDKNRGMRSDCLGLSLWCFVARGVCAYERVWNEKRIRVICLSGCDWVLGYSLESRQTYVRSEKLA